MADLVPPGSGPHLPVPRIPVGWGELLDKIAILTIKRHRLRSPRAVANAERERQALLAVAEPRFAGPSTAKPAVPGLPIPGLAELRAALAAVNQRLWTIEDRIREHEAVTDFGPGFVALARAVYRENDERGRIKRAIDVLLVSDMVEEKQYSVY